MTRLPNGCYWADGDAAASRWPWPLRLALLLGAVVWLLAAVGVRSLIGQQVEPVVRLTGVTATLVANTSTEAQAVTVGLFHAAADGVLPDTTRPADALVSPRAFVLAPGAHQVVRLRLREAPRPSYRLVSCFTPVVRRAPSGHASITTRLCLNALATAGS